MDNEKNVARARGNRPEQTHEEAFDLPVVDIYEVEDRLVLLAEMPGVDEAGVDVRVENDQLTVLGRSAAASGACVAVIEEEFAPRNYRRVFALSQEIDRAGIKGNIRDGVLRIDMPKSETAKVRRIPVRSA